MTPVWTTIVVLGVVTVAIRATGPITLGDRALPPRVSRVVALLAPSLLAALVAIETFSTERTLVVDARLAGLVAAGVALALRQSMTVVIIVAAAVTAVTRALA
jgi:branched-subunit amino acid transport protein